MFVDNKPPQPVDLQDVSPAQRKSDRKVGGEFAISQQDYVDNIVKGVNKIFDTKDLPDDARAESS